MSKETIWLVSIVTYIVTFSANVRARSEDHQEIQFLAQIQEVS